jgi:hypothetical protein
LAKFRSFRVICGRVRIEADPLTLWVRSICTMGANG